ncbi:MAG: hypothetical protein IKS45_11875 [Thermoguttaceae bacterium]|nr:hypothetical protein [Thermoguttaceae bacterium]
MNSWKDAVDNAAKQFDRPDVNLSKNLSAQQRQDEFGIIADLSDKQVRQQAIDDAKELLYKLGPRNDELNSSQSR